MALMDKRYLLFLYDGVGKMVRMLLRRRTFPRRAAYATKTILRPIYAGGVVKLSFGERTLAEWERNMKRRRETTTIGT